MAQPKRLPGILYNELSAYFVTSVTRDRIKAFDLNDFGPIVVRALIEIAARFQFAVTAYCVMPDHVHFIVTAISEGAEFQKMVANWKQRTGYAWSLRHKQRLWQHGYFERVLREKDDPLSLARYIIENPVRAGLVEHPMEYPLSGSTEHSMEEICAAVQMKGWWRPQ
jgi:putative transposase